MTFNRTLSQLADEYFEQAQVLDGIIARHRKQLSDLPNPETSDEAYKIKTLLNVLYKRAQGRSGNGKLSQGQLFRGGKQMRDIKNNNTFGRNGSG